MNNRPLAIIGICFVTLAVVTGVIIDVTNGDCDPMIQDFYNQVYRGKIVGKKRLESTNVPIVYLNDSSQIVYVDALEKFSLYDELSIGDSLSKEKNSLVCYHFMNKKDTTYRFELNIKDCKNN